LNEKAKTLLRCTILATLLVSAVAVVSPVRVSKAQEELPREEVHYHSSSWGPPPGWNPLLPSTCWAVGLMYPTLYLYAPYTDRWIPYAAESYEWIDKYTLQVKIKDAAKWWDGEPITADDVKYTLELGKKYVVGTLTPIWDYIENVEVIDEKTVQFVTSDAKLNYFQMLGVLHGNIWIMPRHRWEALEAQYGDAVATEFRDDVPEDIVGGGPYRLMSWTEEVYYYERVDDWWGRDIFGLPTPRYIGHVTFKDNIAAALAFEGGELDTMTHFTPKIWEMWEVKGLPVRTYYAQTPYYIGGDIIFLYLNFAKAPLANTALRRAVAHALPFDDMISRAYFNYSIRAASVPIVHTSPAAGLINEDLIEQYGWEYDLEKAKQILDDAGIVDTNGDGIRELDGTELTGFTISVPYGWSDWMMMCDMIATNLAQIGIGVQTDFPDYSVWWSRLAEKDWDFVIGWSGATPGYAHPWNGFRWLIDNRLSHPSGNWENYDNPDVVPLIDAIPKESDPVKLKAIYDQLQEIWLQDLPGIPLFYGAVWYEYSEQYWVGWPNEENGFWFAAFWNWPGNMPVLFTIAPAGGSPAEPSWVTDTQFPTSQILADLAEAPIHGYITVTTTTTVTSLTTSVVTTTTERVVPTMDVTTVAGAGIVALVVGAIVGWLLGSRKS